MQVPPAPAAPRHARCWALALLAAAHARAAGANPLQPTGTSCIPLGGFRLCNRSLGLQYTQEGRQSCEGAAQEVRSFGFTWNRRPAPARQRGTVTLSGVAVALLHRHVHKALLEYIEGLRLPWVSWDKHLLSPQRNPDLAVLLVLTSFTAEQDAASLAKLLEVTHLRPLGAKDTAGQQFELADGLGRPHKYLAFQSLSSGSLVLVTFNRYPAVSNAELDKRPPINEAPADYTYGTNWYAFEMSRLPVMDLFDTFYKIDTDITFLGPAPTLKTLLQLRASDASEAGVSLLQVLAARTMDTEVTQEEEEESSHSRADVRRIPDGWALFMHTGTSYEPSWATDGIVPWRDESIALEESRCAGSTGAKFACRCSTLCADVNKVFYSNFVGGALGFWQSPEVMALASRYEKFKDGMWVHRWTDQQWFPNVLGLFLSDEEYNKQVNDLASLRGDDFRHDLLVYGVQSLNFSSGRGYPF